MSVKKGLSRLTSFLIWLAAIALMISLVGAYVNPEKLPLLGIGSLLIGPLIALNVLLLAYCILRKKRTTFGVAIALLLAGPQILNLWGFHIKSPQYDINTSEPIKILSYNVRNFDLYNWSENEASRETIYEKISSVNADIICFQEFYSYKGGEWDNIKRLKELGYQHYYFTRELVNKKGRQWGIATFSKYPIIDYNEFLESPRLNQKGRKYYKGIYTDVAFPSDTIRIVNVHLASLYFEDSDYDIIENISEPEGISIEKSKPIVSKLLNGYERRGNQVEQLHEFLHGETKEHSTILCGDFNDIPTSFAYNRLSNHFQDGFIKTGWGLGASYNGLIPGLRIDFTFVDKDLIVEKSQRIDLHISDHLPLLTTISIPIEE